MKAAAYARYSTTNQTDNSIAAQMDGIFKYCQNNGHIIEATYIDEAKSGTNTDRDGFQRMVSDAKRRLFEAVVIYDTSRGSRDIADWFTFRKVMQSHNIKVLSATQTLGDISNPNDFLIELINVGLGQHMVLQTRQKSIAGVAQRAKQGAFLGGIPPLGYEIENGVYKINEREAVAVRLIFAAYASGNSYGNIIDELAKKGYNGKRGKPIGKNALHAILKNERYIGVYTWNKVLTKNMGKWAGGGLNPDVVRIDDKIPSIIDKNTWEKVRNRMSDNKKNARNSAKHEYLLSGLIYCEQCGAAYIGKTTTNSRGYTNRYYVCGNKHRSHSCESLNINASDIEEAVIAELRSYLLNSDYDDVADTIIQLSQKNDDCADTEKEITKLKTELANLISFAKQGSVIPEIYEEMKVTRAKIADLEQELIYSSSPVKLTKEQIIERIKKDAERITPEDMPRLIKEYVQKIYANDKGISVIGGVTMDYSGRGT